MVSAACSSKAGIAAGTATGSPTASTSAFTESYPDFDLPQLSAYARERGVRIIGHHETAGAVENYESQLDAAMSLYAANGVSVVKTGYVKPNGSIEHTLDDGSVGHEWFAGQYRVNHEAKVAEDCGEIPDLDRRSRTREGHRLAAHLA